MLVTFFQLFCRPKTLASGSSSLESCITSILWKGMLVDLTAHSAPKPYILCALYANISSIFLYYKRRAQFQKLQWCTVHIKAVVTRGSNRNSKLTLINQRHFNQEMFFLVSTHCILIIVNELLISFYKIL